MTNHGFDPASDVAFKTEMKVELRHMNRQIDLLWDHHAKRRRETQLAEKRLREEIESIRSRINGGILWAAIGASGVLFQVIRPKLGL